MRHTLAVETGRRGRHRTWPADVWRWGRRRTHDTGLGVELDGDTLARLHEQYEKSHIRTRDDTAYMREFDPDIPGE